MTLPDQGATLLRRMRRHFPGYYHPSKEEVDALWRDAPIAIDANVLLNLYRYSDATAAEFLQILAKLGARMRIPHQFALEFSRNRAQVILQQVQNYLDAEKSLQHVIDTLRSPNRHPFIDSARLVELENAVDDLRQRREEHERLLQEDQRCDRLFAIFDNVVGPPMPPGELDETYSRARKRYAAEVPPGYSDGKKPEPNCFGDYIGWLQLIELGKVEKQPIIFVTADSKEDWWLILSGKTIGPRPELIAEFAESTGVCLYMYSFGSFVVRAGEFLGQKVTEAAIEEVKQHQDGARVAADLKSAGTPKLDLKQASGAFAEATKPAPPELRVEKGDPKSPAKGHE